MALHCYLKLMKHFKCISIIGFTLDFKQLGMKTERVQEYRKTSNMHA